MTSSDRELASLEDVVDGPGSVGGFHIRLDNFEGPFDLLLSLISRHKLDVTEVALSQVTDEFLSYLAAAARWDLGQATEFLVVAATLLDLKTARLLPSAVVEDDEDIALLEARDLLFARLVAVPGVQAGGRVSGRARGGGGAPARPGGRARVVVHRVTAGGDHRRQSEPLGGVGGGGAHSETGPGCRH